MHHFNYISDHSAATEFSAEQLHPSRNDVITQFLMTSARYLNLLQAKDVVNLQMVEPVNMNREIQ